MTVQEIENQVIKYQASNKRLFISSSFQTHSIPLLHIFSQIIKNVDVVFINTGFHFPETLSFRDEVVKLLGLNLIDVHSFIPKNQQRDANGQFYFVSDPDYCCFSNKVQPLEPYLMQYDIWVTGVRADQSSTRKSMQIEQEAPFNTTRFHPILDWSPKQIYEYRKLHNLPEHPLDKEGYQSIGCAPCTRKLDLSDERSARWFGMNKNECGLHKDLIK
jgi:phosphoadenosine phosphosulfate reductase